MAGRAERLSAPQRRLVGFRRRCVLNRHHTIPLAWRWWPDLKINQRAYRISSRGNVDVFDEYTRHRPSRSRKSASQSRSRDVPLFPTYRMVGMHLWSISLFISSLVRRRNWGYWLDILPNWNLLLSTVSTFKSVT